MLCVAVRCVVLCCDVMSWHAIKIASEQIGVLGASVYIYSAIGEFQL